MTADPDCPLPFGAEHAFLRDFSGFVALREALESGVIDALAERPRVPVDLAAATGLAEPGLTLLLSLLAGAGIVTHAPEGLALDASFAAVLADRRDLLEAKIAFLSDAVADIGADLHGLLFDLAAFQARSRTFGLFRYDRAQDVTPAALAATRRWVRYVTALSISETPHLVGHIDLGASRRLLEVGGNTGVLSEALLNRAPQLSAVVLDLPAVCALGAERMRGRPAAERLHFVPGDARAAPWPGPVDAVLFKSVLHDWPEAEMRQFLTRAVDRLSPGGRIVICERAPLPTPSGPLPLWMMANLVFAPFYRAPADYAVVLQELGLSCAAPRWVTLDLPFFTLIGQR
ncbi:MAG: methyltransferase [Rhodobacteraceae bacterium]|nr:methyltransferase [Paracoccaceae bacterium]